MGQVWKTSDKKIYVDANVFLNVWFKEMMKNGTIYQSSKKLLRAVIDCHYHLVISNLVITELSKKMGVPSEEIIDEYLREFFLVQKIDMIKISRKIADEASHLYSTQGIHMIDAIHAIAASLNECVLVTRDKELIVAAQNIELQCCEPEFIQGLS